MAKGTWIIDNVEIKIVDIIIMGILIVIILIGFGWVCGSSYELHHTKSIDKQHEELTIASDYIYCPYCGEELNGK